MARPKARYDGKAASRQARRAVMAGLNKWIDKVAAQSRREVPKDQLPLVKSQETHYATAGALTVGISYDTEYAVIQHEDLTFHHPTPGTKAKYVEDPIDDWRPKIGVFVADAAKRAGLR